MSTPAFPAMQHSNMLSGFGAFYYSLCTRRLLPISHPDPTSLQASRTRPWLNKLQPFPESGSFSAVFLFLALCILFCFLFSICCLPSFLEQFRPRTEKIPSRAERRRCPTIISFIYLHISPTIAYTAPRHHISNLVEPASASDFSSY